MLLQFIALLLFPKNVRANSTKSDNKSSVTGPFIPVLPIPGYLHTYKGNLLYSKCGNWDLSGPPHIKDKRVRNLENHRVEIRQVIPPQTKHLESGRNNKMRKIHNGLVIRLVHYCSTLIAADVNFLDCCRCG